MSEPTGGAGGQLRTLAVRITEDLWAQLDVVAQITGRSTTEEIRVALEHWVERTTSDPEIQSRTRRRQPGCSASNSPVSYARWTSEKTTSSTLPLTTRFPRRRSRPGSGTSHGSADT
jgi:hypothetical protein